MSTLRQKLLAHRTDKIPPGWLSRDALARKEGYGSISGGFHYVLQQAIDAGLIEVRFFRAPYVAGIRRTRFFRYVK